MKKFIFNIIFILLVSFWGYSQTGLGYVNYRVIKTQNGNGTTWTYDGVTYGGMVDNQTEFDAMFDLTNPANTLVSSGEVLANSNQGFAGGSAPGRPNDFFVAEYTGWFYAELGGNYMFYSYSDDSADVWVNGTRVTQKYGGPGTVSGWITLEAGTWYPLRYRYHENGGAAYGYLQVYGPKNGYFYPGGAGAEYQVSNTPPVYPHKLDVTYNLNSTLNKTKFNSSIIYTDLGITTTTKTLSSNGVVSYSSSNNGLDETLYPSGNSKVNLVEGGSEFCVIYGYDTTNKRYRIGLDSRMWSGTSNAPQWDNITKLKIFDLWDGVVTPISGNTSTSVHWNEYYVYTDTEFDWVNSTYSSYIRNGNGYYALKLASNFTFENINGFTTHKVKLDMDETYFTTTYSDMITIADIAVAFSELTNSSNSPDGMSTGGVYTSDIQYLLSDVNEDGSFNFDDTYLLLQHVFGQTSPLSTRTIDNTLFMFDGNYTNSLSGNWISKKPSTRLFTHILDENNKEQTKSIDVAFLGDVNFSHSSTLRSPNSSAKSSPILLSSKVENSGYIGLDILKNNNEIEVIIEIPKNTMNITGTQFKVYFDTTKLEYQTSEYSNTSIQNFSSKRENYINIGSFSSDGLKTLNEGMVYKLKFKSNSELNSTLGLVVVGFSELVNKDGTKIEWIIR